jgi:hypothetical protein
VTAYVIESPFGQQLFEALEPWQTEDLARWCNAAGAFFDIVVDLAEEVGSDGEDGYLPPLGKLFDPDLCPYGFLPFLAAFVGVKIPVGTPEAEARALLKAESGFARGTRASIEAAIERCVSGEFQLIERRNAANEVKPWHFVVVVKESKINQSWFSTTGDWTEQTGDWELLSASAGIAALEAAVNKTKPAGLMWTLILSKDHPWLEVAGTWESQTHTWALT